MRQWVGGLVSIVLLPACSLYWETPHDKADASPRDASRRDASPNDAPPCAVVVSYDWNDGTPQGWTASTAVSNVGGALVFTNQGNGSLQAFGPEAPSVLAETDVISFTVRIDQYSAVTAPSQLTRSFFSLNTPFPGDGTLQFALDVSTLAFGQPHVYTFSVSAGSFTGSLTRAAFLGHVKFASLLFAEQSFSGNTSAGTLDDFKIVRTACTP
jgi:hypothetical protein